MISKVAVVVYIMQNGKPLFFVGQRTEKYNQIWQYVTGHCEGNESPRETVLRELNEELGDVRTLNFIDLKDVNNFSSSSGKRYHEEIFAVEIDEVKKLQEEEFQDFKWLSAPEAIELAHWPSHKKSIERVAQIIKEKKYPKIFIITGPSGSGKDTVINGLLECRELRLAKSRTATTRARRNGETNERIFVDESRFDEMFKSGELIERNMFNNNWYGASRSELINVLMSDKNAIMEIDLNGVISFKSIFSNVVAIFLRVEPDFLRQRLLDRGTEDKKTIEKRLLIAESEMENSSVCDYVVDNKQGKVNDTIKKVTEIIRREEL
jgi:guanylate kinase